MDPLDVKNPHGVTLREGASYWQVGEASLTLDGLASDSSELDKHSQDRTIQSVWDHLSPETQRAVAEAWTL